MGVVKCAICRKKCANVPFFRVPKDEMKFLRWKNACGARFTKTSGVCEDHFVRSDFINPPGGPKKPRLLPSAVPMANTVDGVRRKWKGLNDIFRRENVKYVKRRKENDDAGYPVWKYYHPMSFLEAYIGKGRHKRFVSSDEVGNEATPHDDCDENLSHESNSTDGLMNTGDVMVKNEILEDSTNLEFDYEEDNINSDIGTDEELAEAGADIFNAANKYEPPSAKRPKDTPISHSANIKQTKVQMLRVEPNFMKNVVGVASSTVRNGGLKISRVANNATNNNSHSVGHSNNNNACITTTAVAATTATTTTTYAMAMKSNPNPFLTIATKRNSIQQNATIGNNTVTFNQTRREESITAEQQQQQQQQPQRNDSNVATSAMLEQRLFALEQRNFEDCKKLLQHMQQQQQYADDEDYHFALSLVPTMRGLPQRRKLLVRAKIQKILCEEIDELDPLADIINNR